MMESGHRQNDFLRELLHLQQDGKGAISAPTNWTHPPFLEVKVDEVDKCVLDLGSSILGGSEGNSTARWHFFIGSPGNGKSAAMGKLCRHLRDRGCQVRDDENDVDIDELDRTEIPYALNIYENGNNYATAQIVQDASVVRKPFSNNVDPAKELCETMKSALEKGISLVVCTNRGVLEKAFWDNHLDQEINSRLWFKVLRGVVSQGDDFSLQDVKITSSRLDNRSLLLGRDTFESLVKEAVDDQNWRPCNSCASREMCPFKANRDWLANDDARDNIVRLLKRAEVLSGQVIVFREALAIISLLLAGCPKDYDDHGHPCEWVRQKIDKNDVFSIATRRIYMCLLASYSPLGLESIKVLRKDQVKKMQSLGAMLREDGSKQESREAMKCIIESRLPSTDVGVTRILGASGIMAKLDACCDALPADFYDQWDADLDAMPLEQDPLFFTPIERTCVEVWKDLENCLERASEHDVSSAHWALRRWSSNFLLHFGALLEGRSAWSNELDNFSALLDLVVIPVENRTIAQKREIMRLEENLEHLLSEVSGGRGHNTVQLSKAVKLSGEWVSNALKPKIVSSEATGSVSLEIELGEERAVLAADMYLWLTRRLGGKLDGRCFPMDLLSGARDARVRAASKGKYAFEDNKIELLVDSGKGNFKIERIDGEVYVSHV